MQTNLLNWLVIGLCLVTSFLLSGMEAGVFALNRLRVRRLARAGNRLAQLLHGYLEKPERFLWTILVGNTLANFLILGWILAWLHVWLLGRRLWETVIFVAVVFLFYVFFDLLPKMLFRAYPNQLCLSSARVFRFINLLLSLPVLIVEKVSHVILRMTGAQTFTGRLFGNREEMRAVMQESAQSLSSDERAMINRVLDLQNFTVGQFTTPLSHVVVVERGTPLGTALALARERNFSRLPVWEVRDGAPRIIGLVATGKLLFRDDLDLRKPVTNQMTPALFLGEDTRLEVALRRLQRAGERLAIVLARDGSEMGVLSLEDILKVMFGEVKL
jgi:CBS domain containing-hemolysin-like protein